jgi:biopolymer transport protein ExbD
MAFSTGNKKGPISDINVTPMVDVMLVLLIIFMVTAPMMFSGIPLKLPKTQKVSSL